MRKYPQNLSHKFVIHFNSVLLTKRITRRRVMNYYGLPEFIAYSMLLGISYNLIRQKREERLQYWLIGWELILVHSAIFMLFPPTYPFDVVARGTLILAGQSFILAAFYQEPTT